MIVDANMYWFDEDIFENNDLAKEFLNDIVENSDYYGYLENVDENTKQIVIEKPKGYQNLNYIQREYTLEHQIAMLDKAKVDKAILKMPGCNEWLTLKMCKLFNDKMWEYHIKSNRRLVPLATITPVSNIEVYEELDRIKKIGFTGIQLAAHYKDKYLDDKVFRGFFEKVHELDLTVYVHHTPLPVDYNSFLDYNTLRRSFGRCADQILAISREVNSDLFKELPNLRFVHSMLGGGYFAFKDLFKPRPNPTEKVNRFATSNENVNYIEKNIYFELSHSIPWGKDQLESAVKILKSDKIIFGSSYPVKEQWLVDGVEYINNLNISSEDKENILGKNALSIYKIGDTNE